MRTVAESGTGTQVPVQDRYSSIPQVLVLFHSDENRAELLHAIVVAGMVPRVCNHLGELEQLADDPAIIICEDRVPEETFRKTLDVAQNRAVPIPVIVASRTGEWDEFLSALRQGAFDYLVLPPRMREVQRLLELAVREHAGARTAQTVCDAGRVAGPAFLSTAYEPGAREWPNTCLFRILK